MTRITLRTFEQVIETIDVHGGDSVVVGRRPTPTSEMQAIQVGLPSVSSNHVRVEVGDEDARITDLGSKNGTWLKLTAHTPVHVKRDAEVELCLASPAQPSASTELPADATWTRPTEFADAVASALAAWFEQRGIAARVSTASRPARHRHPDHEGQIPLAVPVDLNVVPLETTDAGWADVLSLAWRYVARQNDVYRTEQELRDDGLVLAAPVMRNVIRTVIDAARRGLRIMLLGPSGAGKDVLARCYHRYSERSGAFVARNCAMLSRELVRAELFGAERGSFTGSVQRITGAVERAHGGTLFLDEVGELGLDVQAMLLRFLDTGEYEPLGEFGSPSRADVRIVCATNKDLRAACAAGTFRSDLWYRLSIQVVEVPRLAERYEDMVAYLEAVEIRPSVNALTVLTDDALEVLRGHAWEGNFRELANFVARIPRDAQKHSISEGECRRLLAQGALTPIPTRSRAAVERPTPDAWADLAARAASAFREDHEDRAPMTWDDVKEYIEKYLKPVLFAHLGSASAELTPSDVRACAERLGADRATAFKQLERYFQRFGD